MRISERGIQALEKMKGKTIVSITADDWRSYKRSYGSICINLEDVSVEIENDYREVSYFDSTEELAGYDVRELVESSYRPLVMRDRLYTEALNQRIKSIKIVRDTISVNYLNARENECHEIDQAIIFELESMTWMVSQASLFSPMSNMIFGKNAENLVKSVDEAKSDWEDDESDKPGYEIQVTRTVLEL